MLSLGLTSSKEFWLNVSNSVLGSAVLVLLVLLIFSLIMDVMKRKRQLPARRADHGTTSDISEVGVTLPDGGEKIEEDRSSELSCKM